MAIDKLPTGGPFNNIRKWLYERTKVFTPNPMKPFEKDTTKEQHINANFLSDVIMASHAPNGRINKLINEVNNLIKKVQKNEDDIRLLKKRLDVVEKKQGKIETKQKTKSKTGHTHQFIGQGTIFPSKNQKGGKLEKGGAIQIGDMVKDINST